MKADFSSKVVVVTGAARGIGLNIAARFAEAGATLILVDSNERGLASAVDELNEAKRVPVHPIHADLSEQAACAMVAQKARELTGRVDVLVNNAGIEIDAPFDQVKPEIFDRVLAVNLRAPFLLSQALVPLFAAEGGAIVNISSIHADHAFPNAIPYACSKAGLKALTRNLALELAPRRIRVNAVCPGYIDTPMWEEWLESSEDAAALANAVTGLHPLGRRGVPDDVAGPVLFLSDTDAAWITGSFLIVDGGLTIRAHP